MNKDTMIHMDLGKDSYDIVISKGCLKRAGELLDLDRKVMVVTDTGVPEKYAAAVADQARDGHIITIKSGEENKTLAAYESILRKMLQEGFTRKDCVVAVSGGMPGDMAGFAAATYMRGVDFYNIPTTVLSQVDSSVGGKTAIDLDGIKNIVGAFYQPKKVLIDTDTHSTLPARQISAGLCEALKMSMTSDPELFSIFEDDDPFMNIPRIIEMAVKIKRDVVEKDEKEQGLRKILNFGHTIGHGIESAAKGSLYHGECVAMGMIPMCSPEVRERLIPILEKLSLPTGCSLNKEDIYKALIHDKKSSGSAVSAVYVNEIGKCEIRKTAFEEIYDLLDIVTAGPSGN